MIEKVIKGAIGGLFGGLVFGLWMAEQGTLPTIAKLVGSSSAGVGFLVHMVNSTIIGGSFGFFFSRWAGVTTTGLLLGLVYGFVWWFLGPLTLMPLGLGMGIQWSAASVSATLPSLTWHLVFGGVLGVSYVALNRESLAFLRGRS